MSERAIKATVQGVVQGVFFRKSTKSQARDYGLVGYAKNLANGDVEVVAKGDDAHIQQFIHYLHQGPEQARVDRVAVTTIDPHSVTETGFSTY